MPPDRATTGHPTVTCRTRRAPASPKTACCACEDPINPGDRYRELVAVRCDYFDRAFVRTVIHERCIGWDRSSREWWRPT